MVNLEPITGAEGKDFNQKMVKEGVDSIILIDCLENLSGRDMKIQVASRRVPLWALTSSRHHGHLARWPKRIAFDTLSLPLSTTLLALPKKTYRESLSSPPLLAQPPCPTAHNPLSSPPFPSAPPVNKPANRATIQVLVDSGLGKTVKGLRKHADAKACPSSLPPPPPPPLLLP